MAELSKVASTAFYSPEDFSVTSNRAMCMNIWTNSSWYF